MKPQFNRQAVDLGSTPPADPLGSSQVDKTVVEHLDSEVEGDGSPRPAREILARLLPIVGAHWRILTLAVVLSLAGALLWLLPPYLISLIIDRAMHDGDRDLLVTLTAAIVAVALVILVVDVAEEYCVSLLSERFTATFRVLLFNSLQQQGHRFFLRTNPGAISSRMFNDIFNLEMLMGWGFANTLGTLIPMVCTLVFMFVWNWRLSVVAISFLPIVFFASLILGKMNREAMRQLSPKYEELDSFVHGRLNINSFMILNGFGYRLSRDSARFAGIVDDLRRVLVRQSLVLQGMRIISTMYPVLAGAALYFYGGLQVIDDDLTLGLLLAFIALSMRLVQPVSGLAHLNVSLVGSLPLLERLFNWIDLEPDIVDSVTARDIRVTNSRLEFRDVSFEYEPNEPVLSGLSFQGEPGQLTALVGPSGSGKTTATNLMLRFYDPTSGSIAFGGHDLREFRLNSLRSYTSIVLQDSVVLSASVRENLQIARSDASDDELLAACASAQLSEVIDGLPDGLDTTLGEFGYRFSGGERQRLAIARAILKQPKLLIMDEPTSALDSITEAAVRRALSSALSETTTIVIAHRLSTVLAADKILVLDGGRCVDEGRHGELLDRCELYRRLYEEQFAPEGA